MRDGRACEPASLRWWLLPLGGVAQPVADAGLGQQVARAAGFRLDFAAELADEDAQIVRLIFVRWPPYRP